MKSKFIPFSEGESVSLAAPTDHPFNEAAQHATPAELATPSPFRVMCDLDCKVPRGFGITEFRRALALILDDQETRAKELYGLTDKDVDNIGNTFVYIGIPRPKKARKYRKTKYA